MNCKYLHIFIIDFVVRNSTQKNYRNKDASAANSGKTFLDNEGYGFMYSLFDREDIHVKV